MTTSATVIAPTPDDVTRAAALDRMKRTALLLLLAAAGLFVLARVNERGSTVWGYIRAFAEAAMVGALADWFAVTALFRHPLGLPIPHTAIIPERKDQLGRSLGQFVQTNFASHEVILERISSAAPARRAGEWLEDPAHAARAADLLLDGARAVLQAVDDQVVDDAIGRVVEGRVRATTVAPVAGSVLDLALRSGQQRHLLDVAFRGLANFLDDNKQSLRRRLQQESPWWVPERIDDRIFAKILDGAQRFLADVGGDPDHEVRGAIEQRLAALAERLQHDDALIAEGERMKHELLDRPDARAWMSRQWSGTKRGLLAATNVRDGELHARITALAQRMGERLVADEALRDDVDARLASAVEDLVTRHGHQVARLVETTIERWDGEQTARKLELQVGRDLQFIRINGTVVGGLAGLLIHAFGEVVTR